MSAAGVSLNGEGEDVPHPRRLFRTPEIFRDRNFALLWSGQTISETGSAVTTVALPLVAVGSLGATPFEVGLITAMTSIAWLLVALPAGVWIDRLPRRKLLIFSNAGQAAVMGTIPIAWGMGVLELWLLIGAALILSMLSVLFDIGYPAYLPSVAGRERLVEANSALATSESAARVVGPSVGGGLVQILGAPLTLAADAISFAISALSLAAIRQKPMVVQSSTREGLLKEVRTGLKYVRAHPLTRTLAVSGALGNLVVGGYQAVVVVFLVRQVGLRPAVIGVLFTVTAVGGLVGSLIAAPLARRLGSGRVMIGASAVMAAFGLLIPLTSAGARIGWYVAGALPLSLGIATSNVCIRAAMQVAGPQVMLGRITATVRLFSRGATPVGALGAGALAGFLSPRTTLGILMGLLIINPVWLRLSPIGKVRDLAELVPPAT